MCSNVPFNQSSQREGWRSFVASLSTIMISLYCVSLPWWTSCHRANYVIVFWSVCVLWGDTGNACVPQRMLWWCHCEIDRQRRFRLSPAGAGGLPTANPDPLFFSPQTHTPIPQYTVYPSCLRCPLNPISAPNFSSRPDGLPLQTSKGPVIIDFPIINHHCLHTMGPKELRRQQRKHLLLSRQGTNSRILESVSYIHSLKYTHKHTHVCMECRHKDNCFLLLFHLIKSTVK